MHSTNGSCVYKSDGKTNLKIKKKSNQNKLTQSRQYNGHRKGTKGHNTTQKTKDGATRTH